MFMPWKRGCEIRFHLTRIRPDIILTKDFGIEIPENDFEGKVVSVLLRSHFEHGRHTCVSSMLPEYA